MTDESLLTTAHVFRALSQATNRSIAGATAYLSDSFRSHMSSDFFAVAQEWGLRFTDHAQDCPLQFFGDSFTVDGEKFMWHSSHKPSSSSRSASEQIARAYAGMPVVRHITDEFVSSRILASERIAVSLIIEPKTAVLLLELHRAGAQVGVYAPAAEVHQPIADELATRGIKVYAHSRWTPAQEHEGALALLDELKPTIIIDDGASFARLASIERPELVSHIKGVAEETTSGVRAFSAMEDTGALTYPVIASNDSQMKTSFDNVHGTGETCVTTLLNVMGDDYATRSSCIAVIGFGPVGRGFARRMRSLKARVIIVEQSATAALKAQYEGFDVLPLKHAIRISDCIISATGVRHTLDVEALQSVNDGTVLGVIGGISNEIALDGLTALTGQIIEPAQDITQLDLGNGKYARLIASADGMNYTISNGNPIEIMDMSFAVQLNAIRMLINQKDTLGPHVIRMDNDIDEFIARSALEARHTIIDDKQRMVTDWTHTRFADAHAR
ncbi:adenosylhomocysteinase [Alloscardovia venturai]|uniref:Adenosylhomocysteinase n=1 Tax=Alloscardovia venturai TaxID=1769421 RepID=A0ABW2Y4Z4_9BIFI